jgi:HSP20 family protein
MKKALPVKKTDSIMNEIEEMRDRITKRAYEIFERDGRPTGRDFDHWLEAEAELLWAPTIDVEEGADVITTTVSVPDIEADDLDVELEPQDLLIKAETEEKSKKDKKTGRKETKAARLFGSVHFSKPVDPKSAKANLKDGVLTLTAKVAEKKQDAKVRKLKVRAA